ncbi:methyl-accepting chemotaxis protein [Parvibium lacunae]|uniref:Methyl-accepting chemotaxis protein n=1 Tax=Parvibium lacunae TaxID=1888893 RepID=A0A368L119_9BURK|nr:methyl-accepting chemotaxis protein [Parvibium lacunae]RCS57004.1 methyl-accepting chemotaxis protein [Parvibium lacunae]
MNQFRMLLAVLGRLSLKSQLISLAILFTFGLLSVLGFGLLQLAQFKQNLAVELKAQSSLVEINQKARGLEEKMEAFNKLAGDLLLANGDPGVVVKTKKELQESSEIIISELSKLNNLVADLKLETLTTHVSQIDQGFKTIRDGYLAAIAKFKGDSPDSFQDMMSGMVGIDTKPTTEKTAALKKLALDSASALAERANDNAAGAFRWTVGAMLFAGLVILSLVGLVTLLLAKNLYQQIGGEPAHASQLAKEIAEGNLLAEVTVEEHDSSSLFYNLSRMQKNLKEVIAYVSKSSQALSSASTALQAATEQITDATNQQSEAANSVAAAIQEVSTSVDVVADNAADALNTSKHSEDISRSGSATVQSAAKEMIQLADSSRELTEMINSLNTQAQQISKIVKVIHEIAGQTNLLALNAAIEAARAGEQGRGFSVVADEVRQLAERTSQSTKEISSMVNSTQEVTMQVVDNISKWKDRVNDGVDKARRADSIMIDIRDGAIRVASMVNEMKGALVEQSSAHSQIARDVERIAQMSEKNSSAISTLASSAKGLNQLSGELAKAISLFKL